jgi:TolB-like protein
MINHIAPQHQASLTYLKKAQKHLFKNAFLIAMLLFVSCATPPRITYEGERNQEEKYHGKGVITYSNGDKWEGEFKDGLEFNGQGTIIWLEGGNYVGEIKDGKRNGQGTLTNSDGEKYVGDFKDNKRDGQGTLTNSDGEKYVGDFKDGNYHGQGTYTFPDGGKYVGEYKDGLPNGQGTLTNYDGSKYVGEFRDNKANGQGTLTYANGSKYVGEFKDGLPYGQGTFTYANGSKYVGEWKDGNKNGQGALTYADGKKYVGEFKDGKPNGKGVGYLVNGEIQSGTWVNDTFQKNWTIEAVDNFLRNKYPQFKGLNYSTPITSVSSQGNEVYLPPPPDNPTFIAVVDFTGNNVSKGDCKALTDRLRAELFNTKHFKVIEREMMEQIIEEQGFQQSGCSTDECMVEVGKLIGVEKIVGGSISKVGRTYSVSSRIVSVETGKILKGATYDYKGEIDELLTTGMRMVAYELIK